MPGWFTLMVWRQCGRWGIPSVSWLLTVLILVAGTKLFAADASDKEDVPGDEPRIFIGNSYHPGFWWSDGEMKGVIEGLRKRWPTLQPHVEFLDQKRFEDAKHQQHFAEYVSRKYRGWEWDLFVFLDTAGLLAALERPEWLGDKPVVFCGVEEESIPEALSVTNITGVFEHRDEVGTVELMWRLLPDTKEAYFLGSQFERYQNLIATSFPDRSLGFHHLADYDRRELLEVVATLPANSVIIEMGYQGRAEELLGPDYKRELSRRSAVPILTHYDHGDGWGLGGRVIQGEHQGRLVAELALRILDGEPAGAIPMIREQALQTVVDYAEMERFKIPFYRVPDDAVIRNRPAPLLRRYRNAFLSLGGLAAGVSVLALVLGRSNYRRRMLFEHASDAIFILDSKGEISEANPAACELISLSEDALTGVRFSSMIDQDDLVGQPFRVNELSSGQQLRTKRILRRMDDSTFVADCNTSRLPGGRIQMIVRDISEQERAEALLRDSEERYRLATEAVEEVVYEWNPETDAVIRSSALIGITGHELHEAETTGKWWFNRIHPDDTEEVREVFREAIESGDDYSYECRMRHKDGHDVYVWDRGRVIRDDSGNVVRCVGATTNLTERRHLEAQLRQAQKMEAIGTLAGGIAHDFNNILTGVIGSAELAKIGMAEDDTMRGPLDDILKASKRATDLVSQILTFSRQGETRRELVDLLPTIREAYRFLRATIPAGIELHLDYPQTLPKVAADPTQIYQALLNLCTNSWHALGDGGGRIGIKVSTRTFRENEARPNEGLPPGEFVVLTVTDNGPGMSPTVRERIFEPFFTTKQQGKGTGLGLSVVHGIMHGHEGAITVDSAPDEGATFEMFLPVAAIDPDAGEREMDSETIRRGSGQRVLVVDDEKLVRSTISQILKHLGYDVTTAEDPVAMIGNLETKADEFDLVLTDLSMPGLNGTEFARSVWALRGDVPIILMTGHLRDVEPDEYLQMGFRDVLQKPVTVPILSKAVAAIFPSGG